MKKITTSLLMLCLAAFIAVGFTSIPEQKGLPESSTDQLTEQLDLSQFPDITTEEFLALTPKQIRKQTGEKLTLKQAIALKAAQKKVKKMAKKGMAPNKPKSQLIALLLCGFLGYLGAHRFYLGYTGAGIAQILTAGGCGIWVLIDLIRLITGDLLPKDGSAYDPEL
ncbi:MAG: TM2 domain-containing protein [Bacteroidota bacterium]